ncbi:MAG: hypothetical protein A2W92_07270 [Bacteroidetes bacterium GWA2_42_15]|nr:MAG: hypothetical protein A2W92_07270 [Bacteroidetes bacterium GWA2_42_15]
MGSACVKNDDGSLPDSYPIADGTFIQDYLVAQWDDTRWQKELGYLKEAGMHYIVFAPTLNTGNDGINRIIYPGNLPGTRVKYQVDLVENCLRNAKKAGFKVFLGLNFNEKWWQRASWDSEWLYGEMELGNQLADDLTRRYKNRYEDTMYGWYWVWEVDNLNHQTTERQNTLIQALNINIDHLDKITPDMPFMLCPFVNYRIGNSQDNRDMWQYVFSGTHFREGDIFAPQDCVGAGGLELGMVDKWFSDMKEAVKSKPGLLFWSDAETFDQRFWTSATLDRFVEQMETVKPYVSNIISFAYSHYYSPFQTTKGFHETYLEYVKTGTLPMNAIPEPVENLIAYANSEGKLNLSWKEPKNKKNLAGYYIFKDNQLIGNLQYKNEDQYITGFQDKSSEVKVKCQYEVCSYTCSGITSTKESVVWE